MEAQLLESPADIKADVLVVGHHGSKTSSRKGFISAVAPNIAVISSGPKLYSTVQLPDKEVVTLLKKSNISLFETDRDNKACAKNPKKIGNDNDGKPGGCDNVKITIKNGKAPEAEYWTVAD